MAVLQTAIRVLVVLIPASAIDEIAFGDVAEDGSYQIRYLDIPVAAPRGTSSLFEADPMAAHDWAHVSLVNRSIAVQDHVAQRGISIAQGRQKEIEESFARVYAALPKNEHGRLSNGTARYALHRYFTEKHKWSLKGLQPAGAAWIRSMSVTPDVKDVSKYIVPTYLQELLLRQGGGAGFDLHSLVILAAAIEHLIRSEITELLYMVYATLEMPIRDPRTDVEVAKILDTFMAVYAFGSNLEVSTMSDMEEVIRFLDKNHKGWRELREFTGTLWRQRIRDRFSFSDVLGIVESIADNYGKWLSRDCVRAKEKLISSPTHHDGRVPLSEVQLYEEQGFRPLFWENPEDLSSLGVLDESNGGRRLIVPNYLNSQSMCLTTASFYVVCCPNECEPLMASLERNLSAPSATPSAIAELVATLPSPSVSAPRELSEPLLHQLEDIAKDNAGQVPLHGRAFAQWLHGAYPLECAAPVGHESTNPKTASEWMANPTGEVQDTEEMMGEIANVLARYVSVGETTQENASATAPPTLLQSEVVALYAPREEAAPGPPRRSLASLVQAAALVSMLGLFGTVFNSVLTAGCGSSTSNDVFKSLV